MSPFTQPNDLSSSGGHDDADSRNRTEAPKGASVWLWVCWLALVATFVVFAFASFRPESRLWGLNHLSYYPSHIRLAVLGIAALFFVPPFAGAAWRSLMWLVRHYFRGLETGANAIALSGVVAFVIFAAFRSSTRLFGDGYFITTSFANAAENGWGIRDYLEHVTISERVYPLTELVNYLASSAGLRLGASPEGGVWILNCALGAAVVVGLLAAARRTSWPDGIKFVVLAVALFTGAIELFFGYIEHYTLAMALGALYLLSAIRAISGAVRVAKPGLVLLACVLCHIQALLLLPSFVWLVAWKAGPKRDRRAGVRIAIAVSSLTIVGAAAATMMPAFRRFFFPLLSGDAAGAGLFSPAHVTDVANVVMLMCPAWLMLALATIRELRGGRRHENVAMAGTGAFAACLAVPSALFLFLFRPELGTARDWDLYSFTFFGLAVPGLVSLARGALRPPGRGISPTLAVPAVVLCAATVVSWVGVNASTQRSVARYRNILTYDLTNAGYAFENLSRYYEDNHQYTLQVGALQSAYESSRNPRFLHKLGRVYYRMGDLDSSANMLRSYLEVRPEGDDARKLLLGILVKRGDTDEMIEVALEGIAHSPRIPDYHFFLGNAYLANGRTEEGLKAFEACSRLNPTPAMIQEMKRLTEQARGENSDSR